jgi:hypothetical protein
VSLEKLKVVTLEEMEARTFDYTSEDMTLEGLKVGTLD